MSVPFEAGPFRALPEEALREILERCPVLSWQRGGVLMRQGEKGDAMYLLLQGRVRVLKELPLREPVVLAEVGAGQVVGEMGLLTGYARSATVIAAETTEALEIKKGFLAALVERYPRLAAELLGVSMARVRQVEDILQQAPAGTGAQTTA